MLKSGIEIPYEIQKVITPDGFHQFLDKLSQFTPDVMSDLLNQFLSYATQDYDRKMTFLSTMTQSQKIVSLSENITSAAMWGYYADDGKGFALSYDLRDINFVDYCLLPVIYGDERFNATQYATWLFQQNIIQQILISMNAFALYPSFQALVPCPDFFMTAKALIHKATYWRHEKEWRLIFYEKSALHLEHPCLTKQPYAIYLGRNISKIHEKILRHIAVEKGIPAYRMTVRDDNPLYELYPQQL